MFEIKSTSIADDRGFTLVELLVVIAIIAILAAILFPVFAQAKEAAKKSVCLSSVKEVAIASVLYCNDYDDNLCFGLNALQTDTEFELQSWYADVYYNLPNFDGPYYDSQKGLLYPYMKSQPIYGCPDSNPLLSGELSPDFPVGFGVNATVMVLELTAWGVPVSPSLNMSQVDAPSETILIADAVNMNDNGNGTVSLTHQTWIYPPSYSDPETWGIHTHQANVGWLDGHAKSPQITIRPNVTQYSTPTMLKGAQQYWVGDVMNPRYPYGSQWQDYYYLPNKPN